MQKGYPVLYKLIEWRETRVRELNVPRRWLADDSVLMDLSSVRPKDLKHLKTFRGLNKGEVKKSGETLLKIIADAKNFDIKPPESTKPKPASPGESRTMDLLKCYLGILADDHQVAVKNLLAQQQLLLILRSEASDKSDLVKQGILTQGAADLIGDELIGLIGGRITLSIDENKEVKLVKS